MPRSKSLMFICPLGKSGSKTRDRSDQVFEYIVKPAANRCGYCAIRADKLPGAMERITSRILKHLLEAHMVVADLTDSNPNVFWELGYRNRLGKPVVQMIQRGQKLPFDVFDIPTVFYSIEVGKYKGSRKELIEKIRAAEKEKKKTAAFRKRKTNTRYCQKKKTKKKV